MADTAQIEEIVRQVLASMSGEASAAPGGSAGGAIPKTAHVAMLTGLEHFDVKEFPMPEVGDDDMLVRVEGCGICGTDAHEFKRDPFGLIPVALGHEGTGEIVKMGKNVKKDSAGKDLKLGDKVVTCMIFKDNPDITMFDLNKQNVGGADVYGLLPDDDIHLNGWFSDYILIRGGSTVFNVSDLDLYSRVLIEPCAVLIHAVERAKSTGILRFNSRVVVQGCGPIGLICIAILRTMGINKIVAVDGEQKRLDFAKELGASDSVNFKEHKGIEALTAAVQEKCDGHLADLPSSVPDPLQGIPISTSSSATAAGFASWDSLLTAGMPPSILILISAPRKSPRWVPGCTPCGTMPPLLTSSRAPRG